ncbi:zinc finger CCCH domain-containing protein [Striga asiatica]|uniref:Zinc finger CCCH domain-containing protein n=1 Tax=Striga asiatica TaxID=4170 RepID=A0A5A7PJL7_STRAF|nr:zinc finger CCCH domain-containing protein [Striga asiatica]
MAELLPPTPGKPPIEKLGLGILVPDTTSHDPITIAGGQAVEIQHGESSMNASQGESGSPTALMADVVVESVADPDELELQSALERDFCQLTIQQAEMEAESERLEAVVVEGGKDVVETVELGDLHGEKGGKNGETVEDEDKKGLGCIEGQGTLKLDNHHEGKVGENLVSVEGENRDGLGCVEDEGMLKIENFHEKKGGENEGNAEDETGDGLGYLEREGTVRLDNFHEEKGGANGERNEDVYVDRWGYMENEGTWKLDNLHEIKGGANAEHVEAQYENKWDIMENEGAWKLDNFHEEKGGEYTESLEDQNENRLGFLENERGSVGHERNGEGKSWDATTKFGRYNPSNDDWRIRYPMRPDAEDCAYYMKSGSCKFGLNCKFNHPPRRKTQVVKERMKYGGDNLERAGQAECKMCILRFSFQWYIVSASFTSVKNTSFFIVGFVLPVLYMNQYYLASGGCRHGNNCRFSHGSGNSFKPQILEFNFLGLPIRPGEKECPFYMRNGSCKYGSNCRFHHPEPTTAVGTDSSSGYGNAGSIPSQLVSSSSMSSWSSPRAINEASSFTPAVFSGGQVAPSSDPEWNGYQAPTYTTSQRSLPTPPAFAMSNLPTEISFPMQHQHDKVLDEYPERPGELECSFFMKTGDCKFKSSCKFHHPKTRIPKPKSNSCTLNDKGLPLRPDQPICTHYHRYGICKFGPACKYDHPSSFADLPTPFDQTFKDSGGLH